MELKLFDNVRLTWHLALNLQLLDTNRNTWNLEWNCNYLTLHCVCFLLIFKGGFCMCWSVIWRFAGPLLLHGSSYYLGFARCTLLLSRVILDTIPKLPETWHGTATILQCLLYLKLGMELKLLVTTWNLAWICNNLTLHQYLKLGMNIQFNKLPQLPVNFYRTAHW